MNETVQIQIENQIPAIEKVCNQIENFGRTHNIEQKVIFALHLALDEILTNIISYGYADEDTHQIDVRLQLDQDRMIIEIEDDGKPFHPNQAPTPDIDKPLQERKIGGLGLYLVNNLMNSVDYQSRNGKNILTLVKKYNPK